MKAVQRRHIKPINLVHSGSIHLSSDFLQKILGKIFIRLHLRDTTSVIYLNCNSFLYKQLGEGNTINTTVEAFQIKDPPFPYKKF